MPFLRVVRDRRGYETTYLMDWYRDGGRQRSRVLYAFRGPSGTRVGREAITPDTARAIEAAHPELQFNWNTISAERQVIESAPERRRPRRPASVEAPAEVVRPDDRHTTAASSEIGTAPAAPAAQPPRVAIPSTLEGETPQEQIAFLQQWYPTIRERVLTRVTDADRQQALLALTERLNPGGWVDAETIAAGLPDAAEALQRLSLVFARRRRARRRAPPQGNGSPGGGS